VVEDALSALESLRAAGTNELQVARVPIAMREAPPLHAHAVDLYLDGAAIVGTANLDNRSFKLDFELCALVFDRQVTGRLADAFEADLTESRAMDEAARAHLSLPRRLGEAGARLLSPLL
jgi:cardiolipin synthase